MSMLWLIGFRPKFDLDPNILSDFMNGTIF